MGKKKDELEEKPLKRLRNLVYFTRKQAHLEERVRAGYIRNGVGIIPCRVKGYYDVISSYSTKGYETINSELASYITETIYYIPPEYPVIIKIVGGNFTAKEKKTIILTLEDDFSYELGAIQRENRRQWILVLLMGIGMILFGLLLTQISGLDFLPTELIYVLFWFTADVFIGYLFLDGRENRRKRIIAGRLANVKVSFAKTEREAGTVTKKEATELYEELFEEE